MPSAATRDPVILDGPGQWWARLADRQPALAHAALVSGVLGLAALAAGLVDPRLYNGVDIWMKPAKFFLSAAIYMATLAWFFPLLGRRGEGWLGRVLAWGTIAGMTVELVIISLQAARGVGSHFNTAMAVDGALFTVMGVTILVTTLGLPLAATAIARTASPEVSPVYRWAVVIGLAAAWLGCLEGMVIAQNGGHWVGGTPSDAGGIPPVYWSRDGGDLRVAHFFGIHAMQAIPLIGFLAARFLPRSTAWPAMLGGAAGYGLFAGWTFLAALDGRPLL
ncbi:MAG: hypothetical protein RLO50_07795 [Azospirillaceae bacterium]